MVDVSYRLGIVVLVFRLLFRSSLAIEAVWFVLGVRIPLFHFV